ncbi:MAG: hypothetical protein WKG07_50310 [Hymenobacter sp.]
MQGKLDQRAASCRPATTSPTAASSRTCDQAAERLSIAVPVALLLIFRAAVLHLRLARSSRC